MRVDTAEFLFSSILWRALSARDETWKATIVTAMTSITANNTVSRYSTETCAFSST